MGRWAWGPRDAWDFAKSVSRRKTMRRAFSGTGYASECGRVWLAGLDVGVVLLLGALVGARRPAFAQWPEDDTSWQALCEVFGGLWCSFRVAPLTRLRIRTVRGFRTSLVDAVDRGPHYRLLIALP